MKVEKKWKSKKKMKIRTYFFMETAVNLTNLWTTKLFSYQTMKAILTNKAANFELEEPPSGL